MTVTETRQVIVGTRDDLFRFFSLERTFVDTWVKAGCGDIPPMPHLPDCGKGTLFHLPTVERWLLDHFQRGGVPVKRGK